MSKIVFPRMAVLHSLDELTADITPNRFITTRPNAVGEQMQEFLLIALNNIEDTADTYQLTRGKISIFVRDVQGGLENTFRLNQLQEAVTGLFPIRTDLYLATKPPEALTVQDSTRSSFNSTSESTRILTFIQQKN